MRQAIKWLLYLLPIMLVVGGISFIGDHSVAAHSFQHESFRGNQFGHHSERFMVMGGGTLVGLMLLPILFKAALLVTGGLMLGLAKGNKGLKIAGAVLLSIGILMLLPSLIAIPVVLVLGYLVYKNLVNQSSSFEDLSLSEMAAHSQYSQNYKTKDYLDEWEKAVRKGDM